MRLQLDADEDGHVHVHGHVDVVVHGDHDGVRVEHAARDGRATRATSCRVSVEGYEPPDDGSSADEVVLVAVVVAVVARPAVEHLRGKYRTDGCPNCRLERTAASIHYEPDRVPDAVALDRHKLMDVDRMSRPKWDRALVAN